MSKPPSDTDVAKALADAAAQFHLAGIRLERQVRRASEAGLSERHIAQQTGRSRNWVRRTIGRTIGRPS